MGARGSKAGVAGRAGRRGAQVRAVWQDQRITESRVLRKVRAECHIRIHIHMNCCMNTGFSKKNPAAGVFLSVVRARVNKNVDRYADVNSQNLTTSDLTQTCPRRVPDLSRTSPGQVPDK
jgi:hypothetical protein